MARRIDPGAVLDVFAVQSALLVEWASTLSPTELAQRSVLPAWTVAELVTHVAAGAAMVAEAVSQRADPGVAPLPLHVYVAGYAPAAQDIALRVRAEAAVEQGEPGSLLARRIDEAISAARAVEGDPVLLGRRGPLLFTTLLRTRVIELVVHGRDLSRSLPDRPVPLDNEALRLVTRTLAEALAERHPGRTVELRIPPYAAVQLLDGGAHTRGTPPNVVETDPGTFVDLASGRVTFTDAVNAGAVRASGVRADLSEIFPMLG